MLSGIKCHLTCSMEQQMVIFIEIGFIEYIKPIQLLPTGYTQPHYGINAVEYELHIWITRGGNEMHNEGHQQDTPQHTWIISVKRSVDKGS